MKIIHIHAREIFNSGGTASLEVKVVLESGVCGRASVPFGVSAGSHEAVVLFDGGTRYGGQGMLQAVTNVNNEIAGVVIGQEVEDQRAIDQRMIDLDGTPNKAHLGGNAILGVSLAVAQAASVSQKMELYEYIGLISNHPRQDGAEVKLPAPMIVVIEGGKHADNSTDFQEYLVVPQIYDDRGVLSVKESVRAGAEVYLALKKILQANGFNTNVGNEGAYAPSGMPSNEAPWQLILEAIKTAGYRPGIDVMLAADPACNEILVSDDSGDIKQYQVKKENRVFSPQDLISYFAGWIEKYPFVSLEDILSEDDWENWTQATAVLGGKVRIIGDDLLVTNPKRLELAIKTKACNGILIKLNQIGTLSETIDTMKQAHSAGFWTIVSHRGGGETNDTSMIDLAVAMGSQMVKVGISRGERVCKYNRLMEIEERIRLK